MKLTKGMKKALSLLLSAAMVVTGVNVTTNTASAADGDATATSYTVVFNAASAAGKAIDATVNGTAITNTADQGWDKEGEFATGSKAFLPYDISMKIKEFNKPAMKVTKLSDNATLILADFNWKNGIMAGEDYQNMNGAKITKTGTEYNLNLAVTDKVDWNKDDFIGYYLPYGASATIEYYDAAPATASPAPTAKATAAASASAAAVTSGASAAPASTAAVETSAPTSTAAVATEAPTKAPATATPEPTEKPDEENQAFLMFTDKDWALGNFNTKVCGGKGEDATITGNGKYTVSLSKKAFGDDAKPANGAQVFCVDIMGICNTQKFDASKIAFSDVVVKADGKEIKTDIAKMYEGDIEGKGNYRLEIRNEYGYADGEFATKDEFDEMNPDFTFEDTLSVTFTIKGIKEGKTPEGAFKTADDKSVVAKGGERAKVADLEETKTTAAPSTKPAVTTTKPAVTTKPAITTAAAVKGTSKLTVAKKLVVVAPNKSVKVAFKATKAKNTSGAAVVKATSKSKKVATVKVKGKNVIIKAPKKAVKGASTTVTLKSTKANGKAISAKIKVYVRNSAKKVKAAKKSITVKKGKTTKLVVKASKVQNKKKAFADTITVKGKVLKLTAVKYAKGKATLTLKGAKKAKKKVVKIKVGKKTVKVKATVK